MSQEHSVLEDFKWKQLLLDESCHPTFLKKNRDIDSKLFLMFEISARGHQKTLINMTSLQMTCQGLYSQWHHSRAAPSRVLWTNLGKQTQILYIDQCWFAKLFFGQLQPPLYFCSKTINGIFWPFSNSLIPWEARTKVASYRNN